MSPTIVVDKDAQVDADNRDEHTEESDRGKLGDKANTDKDHHSDDDEAECSVDANVVVKYTLVSLKVTK